MADYASRIRSAAATAVSAAGHAWESVIARHQETHDAPTIGAIIAGVRNPFMRGKPEDCLPDSARERYALLTETVADLRAAVEASREPLDNARTEHMKARARLRENEEKFGRLRGSSYWGDVAPGAATGGMSLHDQELAAVAAVGAELDKMSARYERRSAAWDAQNRVLVGIDRWLRQLPAGIQLNVVSAEPPALRRGQAPAELLALLTAERDELREKLQAVQRAPITGQMAIARARAQIDAIAERGRPSVFALMEEGLPVTFPTEAITPKLDAFIPIEGGVSKVIGTVRGEATDAFSVLVWLNRDALMTAIENEIRLRADDANALNDEQRARRIAELNAEILAADRKAVALIDGYPGLLTLDASYDPRAVLGVDGPAPKG